MSGVQAFYAVVAIASGAFAGFTAAGARWCLGEAWRGGTAWRFFTLVFGFVPLAAATLGMTFVCLACVYAVYKG